jgi:N-acetylglucosaminyl-diphospho-decaprenol L-rhamnosyltransferase
MTDPLQIQIVNYKTKAYLLACLDSIFTDLRDAPFGYSISILENGSGDDLAELRARFRGKPITWHRSPTNLGFGAGHNLLANNSRGARYLLLLNPDLRIIEPQTIARLAKRSLCAGAQVVGPRLVTPAGKTQWWDHGELKGWRARLALGVGSSYWREQRTPTAAAWVSGAAFFIDRSWFDTLGGFDENFFLYKEEEELCLRLRAMGGKVTYDPTITVFHHGGVAAKKSEHMKASVAYFLEKHFRHRLGYRFFKILNAIVH